MIHYDHMSLQETIKSGIKDAMKAKDSVRLTVLRGLSTAFMNELVATPIWRRLLRHLVASAASRED